MTTQFKAEKGRRTLRRSSFHIEWDFEKRLLLAAAAVVPLDVTPRWRSVARIWASVFTIDATSCSQDSGGTLAQRLQVQWGETFRGNRNWSGIPITSEALRQAFPALMAQVEACAEALKQRVDLPPISMPVQYPAANTPGTPPHLETHVTDPPASNTPALPDRPARMRSAPTTPTVQILTPDVVARQAVPGPLITPSQTPDISIPSQIQRADVRTTRLANHRATYFGPYKTISASDAHPFVPTLLFRMYDPNNSAHMTNDPLGRGFIAGMWNWLNGVPSYPRAPRHDSDMMHPWIELHLNEYKEFSSPFVSVTFNLFWLLTQAIKKAAKGRKFRISILDGRDTLGDDGTRGYFCKPYADAIKKRLNFDPGKWMHSGNHEFLVWATIPPEAVIADFEVADFINYAQSLPALSDILRLDFLQQSGCAGKTRQSLIKLPHLPVLDDKETISALCDMILYVYATAKTGAVVNPQFIMRLLADIVAGWHLRPSRPLSDEEWTSLGKSLVQTLLDKAGIDISSSAKVDLIKAVLFGFQSGYGDPDWLFKPDLQRRLISRARADGLDSPDRLMLMHDDPMVARLRAMNFHHVPATTTTPARPFSVAAQGHTSPTQQTTPISTPARPRARTRPPPPPTPGSPDSPSAARAARRVLPAPTRRARTFHKVLIRTLPAAELTQFPNRDVIGGDAGCVTAERDGRDALTGMMMVGGGEDDWSDDDVYVSEEEDGGEHVMDFEMSV